MSPTMWDRCTRRARRGPPRGRRGAAVRRRRRSTTTTRSTREVPRSVCTTTTTRRVVPSTKPLGMPRRSSRRTICRRLGTSCSALPYSYIDLKYAQAQANYVAGSPYPSRRQMRALALALCALQAVSSERDEHGMRQALRLARLSAPRERRAARDADAAGARGAPRRHVGARAAAGAGAREGRPGRAQREPPAGLVVHGLLKP